MDDLISRKAAIDAVYKCADIFAGDMPVMVVKADAYEALAQLPSAQPETHEERTETHACDCIERQAAIDALRTCYDTETVTMDNGDEYINYGDAIGEIEQLPSAQPETCDTCKHGYFGDTQCDNCCVRYPSHYERRTDG